LNTGLRKAEQLRVSLEHEVNYPGVTTGLEEYFFLHQALPEMDLSEVDVSLVLFGKRLKAPLLISPMTGGVPEARRINLNLAAAAQELGIAMGVGSQRAAIEDPDLVETFRVREAAPDILLFANLGAVQLNNGYDADFCLKAVEMIGADGLILHLNPLQEALQPGGETNFSGLLSRIEKVCRSLPVPVVVKEVGCGISGEAARMLKEAGVAGIDVAGAGGTSWVEVSRYLGAGDVAEAFRSWGIPTALALRLVREAVPGLVVFAGGGIRNGVDAAKAIALGADAVGIAGPLLRLGLESPLAVLNYLETVTRQLRIAMFCSGIRDLKGLKNTPRLCKK